MLQYPGGTHGNIEGPFRQQGVFGCRRARRGDLGGRVVGRRQPQAGSAGHWTHEEQTPQDPPEGTVIWPIGSVWTSGL